MKALALAGMLALSACTAGPTPPDVRIAAGLHPTMTPVQAERLARDAIASANVVSPGPFRPLSVISIAAIPGGMWVGDFLAGVSWIVDIRGPFVEVTGLHPMTTRRADEVRVTISDFDGTVESEEFTT
jgi:hypothetical protein